MNAVAVISRLPALGETKTRLARAVGANAALRLHRAFLEDELEELGAPDQWTLYLVHDAPRTADQAAEAARLCHHRLVPGERGLARELLGAFRALLQAHERVVIVSGDVPQIERDVVAQALAALDDHDVVFGPGPDGGYYLVGMKALHDLFTPIVMSTGAVLAATLAHAHGLGLTVAQVAPLTDIDEAQDLLVLAAAPPHVAHRTREVVAALERSEVAASLPTELQIEVTSRCNLRCSACLRTHEPLAEDADLTLADYRRITRDLPSLARVAFQLNGEPLLCADLFAMVRAAAAAGVHTVVNTNGTLLDERRRSEVLGSGLHELRVSLDGIKHSTVAAMTGADVLDRVTSNVRALCRERPAGHPLRVSLWMVATTETLPELPGLVRLAADVGADEVYVQRLVLTGRGVADRAHSLHGRVDDRVREIVAEAEAVAAETGVALRASGRRPVLESLTPGDASGCWRPWRSAVVTAHGLVLPCCISSFVLRYDALRMGDLTTEPWPKIWNGERYRALRSGLLSGERVPACRGCGVEWSL